MQGKIFSLISILKVYDNPLDILKVWFRRKGLACVRIRGSNTVIKVHLGNVNTAIRLARVIRASRNRCFIEGSKIALDFDSVRLSWDVEKLLSDSYEFDVFWVWSHLVKLNYKVHSCDEKYCVIESSDESIEWITRRNEPDDLRIAVLLPYLP